MPNAPRRAQRLAARPRVEEVAGEEFTDAEEGETVEEAPPRHSRAQPAEGLRRPGAGQPASVTVSGRKPDGNPALAGLTGAQLQSARLDQVKRVSAARDFYIASLRELGTSRDLAIARQRVEEANMWAVKHITR